MRTRSSLVRPYDPARDRAAVRACVVALQDFERALEPSLRPSEAMADAYLDHILERIAAHSGRIFVAELEGALIGFVAVLGRVPPDAPDDEPAQRGYVSDLVVLSAHRGRGLGRRLLEEAERFVRSLGTKRLDIGVLSKNAGAARLYRDFGFEDFRIQLTKWLE